MPKSSYNEFLKGVKRLSQLYDFSMHCYLDVASKLKQDLRSGALTAESHIPSNHGFVLHHRVENTLFHAAPDGFFPSQLRSIILVRLITQFEVYLIEQIRESSRSSGITFNPKGRFEWERQRLLSYDSLGQIRSEFRDNDCRSLSSGGFDEIRKYFQKHLGFDVCPTGMRLSDIREIHARRHLHVHRAGLLDETYKREFGSPLDIGTMLDVTDQYLKDAISILHLVTKHVSSESQKRYPATKPTQILGTSPLVPSGHILYAVTANFTNTTSRDEYFNLDRQLFNDDGPEFKSVFAGGKFEGRKCEWTIVADDASLTYFFRDLRKYLNSGNLTIIEQKRLTPKNRA